MDSTTTSTTGEAAPVFTGQIQGGWGYVSAAYGISLTLLLLYVLFVERALRSTTRDHEA